MTKISLRSRIALNACSFFLACTVTIVAPFLAAYLKELGYHPKAIGIATAMPGLGVLCSMVPVGIWIDRTSHPRRVLASAALCVGLMFAALPYASRWPWAVDAIMFLSGVFESCFTPLLFALALALTGHAGLNRTVGTNQAWNHAGSIAAALVSAAVLRWFDHASIFYSLLVYAVFAAFTCMSIVREDLNEPPRRLKRKVSPGSIRDVLRDKRVPVLLVCVSLFHFVNQPILPLLVIQPHANSESGGSISTLILIA